MQRDFYRVKEICYEFGFSARTLYNKIEAGIFPPLEKPFPENKRFVGYSKGTLHKLHKLHIANGQKLKYDASINTVQIADTTI